MGWDGILGGVKLELQAGGVRHLPAVFVPVIKHLPGFLSPPMEDHLNFLEQIPQSPPQRKTL